MTDTDLRNLCNDLAAAVERGDDPLPLVMLAVRAERAACATIAGQEAAVYKANADRCDAGSSSIGGDIYACSMLACERVAAMIRAREGEHTNG